MILLGKDDVELLRKMESEVSKETLGANFDELIKNPPFHSGSPEEEKVIQVVKGELES